MAESRRKADYRAVCLNVLDVLQTRHRCCQASSLIQFRDAPRDTEACPKSTELAVCRHVEPSFRGLRDANVPCALWFGCGWNDASLPALPLETLIRRPQTHIAIAVDDDSHRSCRRKRVSSF